MAYALEAAINHYPHHIGDFNNATRHLTRVERSLYRDLLDLYYDTERQLPNDIGSLARRILCSTEDRPALETVLQEFFVLDVDGFHNARCDKEIASFQAMAEGGKRGAAKRWGKGLDSHPIATPSKGQCQPEPEPEPKKEISKLSLALARPPAEAMPDCPHQEILLLWTEVLPSMPQHIPHEWKGARADHLRVRWKETAALKNWTAKDEGIAYFRKLFAHIGRSPFLTGRARQTDPSKRPFVIELEWLVNPMNWAKVHEGKYHQDAA